MSKRRLVNLFSYVVARDYGFAPNPFFGVCTLATCKPRIRKAAMVGDCIVGTGSKPQNAQGFLVYVMRVSETMTYNEFWENRQFRQKKPNLRGSIKQAFGDNIYFRDVSGKWHQRDSHHSYANGLSNPHNINHDTQVDRVLIGTDYIYWGGCGPRIPQEFRNYNGHDICALRNHRSRFPAELAEDFIAWIRSLDINGLHGEPLDWRRWHE